MQPTTVLGIAGFFAVVATLFAPILARVMILRLFPKFIEFNALVKSNGTCITGALTLCQVVQLYPIHSDFIRGVKQNSEFTLSYYGGDYRAIWELYNSLNTQSQMAIAERSAHIQIILQMISIANSLLSLVVIALAGSFLWNNALPPWYTLFFSLATVATVVLVIRVLVAMQAYDDGILDFVQVKDDLSTKPGIWMAIYEWEKPILQAMLNRFSQPLFRRLFPPLRSPLTAWRIQASLITVVYSTLNIMLKELL